jgi:hypothetical protein
MTALDGLPDEIPVTSPRLHCRILRGEDGIGWKVVFDDVVVYQTRWPSPGSCLDAVAEWERVRAAGWPPDFVRWPPDGKYDEVTGENIARKQERRLAELERRLAPTVAGQKPRVILKALEAAHKRAQRAGAPTVEAEITMVRQDIGEAVYDEMPAKIRNDAIRQTGPRRLGRRRQPRRTFRLK